MNGFQPMPVVHSQPRRNFLARVWQTFCQSLRSWVSQEPPASISTGRRGAVVICYECRRRVSAEEIASGMHDHPKSSAAAAGSQANEQ